MLLKKTEGLHWQSSSSNAEDTGLLPGLTPILMQGVRVQSLVGELRSHMPRGQKTEAKQKQYCNKLSKDFRSGPHFKKS